MITQFDISERLIRVPALLSGTKSDELVELALDTGAMGILINPEVLERLGYLPHTTTEPYWITTASSTQPANSVVLPGIWSLGLEMKNSVVISHKLPESATIDGLLGLDFFRNHRLTIDFTQGTIEVV